MKRLGLILIVALALPAVSAAQTSVGIILGEPSGLSVKQWIGSVQALEGAVAWSFYPYGAFYVHLDYKQHFYEFDVQPGRLVAYSGVGPRIYIGRHFGIGVRLPIGMVYEFAGAPLEVFIELAPGLNLFPETAATVGGGIGMRFQL